MSRIRGKHTKIERSLRPALRKMGLRFRLHYPIFGRPDLVFMKEKVAVFVDGCFWHKCPEHYNKPRTHKTFWEEKISGNVRRDRLVNEKLNAEGWKVLRFWEHTLERNFKSVASKIGNIVQKRKN